MSSENFHSGYNNGDSRLDYRIDYHGDVVVFDLDDTLMRERDFCRSGFRVIESLLIERYGVKMLGLAMRMNSYLIRRLNYFSLLEEILVSRAGFEIESDSLKREMVELVDIYRSHQPRHLHYAGGAETLLAELQMRGVLMALVTDGRSLTQRRKIEALGLDKYIAPYNIYISEERGVDKSSPDNFQDIVRRYPEAKRFLYIADNAEKDFIMPNILGWTTIEITRNCDNVHKKHDSDDILKAPAYKMIDFSKILTNFQLCDIKN